MKANLPPPERRGLVLIDPSYEERDEAERALRMLAQGTRRFATGVFMLWYPVKGDRSGRADHRGLHGTRPAGHAQG